MSPMPKRPRSAWRSGAFWKSQSAGARFRLLLGVFFTFTAAGFLTQLMSNDRMWSGLQMVGAAAYSGLLAVAFAYAGLRGSRILVLAMAGIFVASLQVAPRLVVHLGREHPVAAAPIERIRFGAIAALASLSLGYGSFMNFIRRDGERHVRLRTEVALAKTIHDGLAPPIDQRTGHYEFLGRAQPSTEIAGDLLDVVGPPDRSVAYVADVTGHGIGAGTVAAMVKSAVRMGLLSHPGLDGVFGDLNRVILQLDRPGLFVTCAAIALHDGGGAHVTLAGHLPVLQIPANGGPVRRIVNGAPPLGVVEGQGFAIQDVRCGRGDLLALVTDGITEVADGRQQEFGLERLEGILKSNAARPLAEIADRVFDAARAFGPQQDDQTLLLVRVL